MTAKIAFSAFEAIFSNKVAYLMLFDLLRTKICIISTYGEQLPVKTVKIKKIKMAAKTGRDAKVETNSLIIIHLISLMRK